MNFLKKGLAQVTAAVEKAREATAAATSSVDAGASSSGPHAPGAPSTSTSRHAPHAPDRDAALAALDPSALPEIRFDERDPNDEHVLFLWTVFAGAPPDSPTQDEASGLLPRRVLRRVRRTGTPPRTPPSPVTAPAASTGHGSAHPGVLIGCALGHPPGVLRALARALGRRRARDSSRRSASARTAPPFASAATRSNAPRASVFSARSPSRRVRLEIAPCCFARVYSRSSLAR